MSEYSPADIMSRRLEESLIGSYFDDGAAWPVTVDHMPNAGNEALTIYNTPARLEGRLQGDGTVIKHPGIQVRIRANDTKSGWKKGEEIEAHLDAIKRTVVDMGDVKFTIQGVHRTSGVVPLGVENDGHRMLFTINAFLTLSEN